MSDELLGTLLQYVCRLLESDKVFELQVHQGQGIWQCNLGGRWALDTCVESVRCARNMLPLAKQLAALANTGIDRPRFSAMLPDGNRAHVQDTATGLRIIVRKHQKHSIPLDTWALEGHINRRDLDTIKDAVKKQFNIAVVGRTGSGKTTLMRSISTYSASRSLDRNRVIIGDINEMGESVGMMSFIVARLSDEERNEENPIPTYAEALRDSLRKTPDEIILTELRGEEALTCIEIASTGHNGLITTFHGTAANYVDRMCIMASEHPKAQRLPWSVLERLARDTFDVVIHMDLRHVVEIVKVERQ